MGGVERELYNNVFRSGNRNFIRPGHLFFVYLERLNKSIGIQKPFYRDKKKCNENEVQDI